MKISEERKEFDRWIDRNYTKLVRYASQYHSDADDLVHHVYLRVIKQDLKNVLINPNGYFRKAIFIEGTRGQFKKLYKTTLEITKEPVQEERDLDLAINREQLEIFTTCLGWFDEQIFRLWLSGENICEIARESGIEQRTLHMSLYRTKKKIKNAFDKLENKK